MSRGGPSLFQAETCLSPGTWMIDGCMVIRQPSGRQWAIYGPCDEYGMTRTLDSARAMIRRGMCENCHESHEDTGCPD